MRKFQSIAIAGTFDRLHRGHRSFILNAFKYGQKVLIGLTSDKYSKSKVKSPRPRQAKRGGQNSKLKLKIQSYENRKIELEDFLKREKLLERVEIVKINDVYGTAIKNNKIEALVITSETLKGGEIVNKKRIELGLKPLKLIVVPLIFAEDRKRIASTRIRIGEIDRWGKIYKNFQFSIFNFQINETLRQELKKPQGILLKGDPKDLEKIAPDIKTIIKKTDPTMIITVGDEVTRLCNSTIMMPHVAIFDYHVNRKRKYKDLSDLGFSHKRAALAEFLDVKRVENPPGFITPSLVEAVGDSYRKIITEGTHQIIEIIGEDDLSGVPAILLAPLDSVVLYGQPGEGVVVVEVTEEKKQQLFNLICKSF